MLMPAFCRFPLFELENMISYCRGQRVIIYGAGNFGKRICKLLMDRKIVPWSFAVTDIEDVLGENMLLGIPVCDIRNLTQYKNDSFVLVASELYYEEMEATLNNSGFSHFQRIYKEWVV